MLSFLYLITVFVLLAVFIGGVITMKYFKNKTLTNVIFCSLTFICYFFVVLIAYIKNGPHDWNFTNTLPTANVSPFMFFVSPIIFILPKQIRKYFATLIALLVVGMILSPVITCIRNFAINYKFHASFLFDYFGHIIFALWGVYLYRTKQCDLDIKSSLIGGAIIITVALIMLVINVIFNQSFFGLSLNNKHSIYNMKLVDNSYLSALIYFTGLLVVLTIGYFVQKLIIKITKEINN